MAGEKIGDVVEVKETRDFVATVKLDKEYLYRISVNPKGEKKISLHTFSTHHESVFDDKNPVFEGTLDNLKELDVSMGDNTYKLKFLIFDELKLADPNATDVLADKYSENTRIGISSEVFVFPTKKGEVINERPPVIAEKTMKIETTAGIKEIITPNSTDPINNPTDPIATTIEQNLIKWGMIDSSDIVGGKMLKGFNKEPTYQELIELSTLTLKKGLQYCFIFGDKACGGCVELKNTIAKCNIPNDVVVFDIPGKDIDENDPDFIKLFGIDHSNPDNFYNLPRVVAFDNGSLIDYTSYFMGEYTNEDHVQSFLNGLQKNNITA